MGRGAAVVAVSPPHMPEREKRQGKKIEEGPGGTDRGRERVKRDQGVTTELCLPSGQIILLGEEVPVSRASKAERG